MARCHNLATLAEGYLQLRTLAQVNRDLRLEMDRGQRKALLVRHGGEEFVAILQVKDSEELQRIAERIREQVGAGLCGGMLALFVPGNDQGERQPPPYSLIGRTSWPRPHRSQPPASPPASTS